MKNIILLFSLLSVGFTLFFTESCTKGENEDTPPDKVPENVIETVSATIGISGGTVSLTDGAALTITAGKLSSDVKVTLSKIGNENFFAADNRTAYDVAGLPKGTKINLSFPCPAGKPANLTGVFNYDPVKFEGTKVVYSYDSINGKISVDNYYLLKSNREEATYRRWIVEWGEEKDITESTKLIPMPYYAQIASSCWAADVTMLTKAYSPKTDREAEIEIYDYLKEMNLTVDDGIGPNDFVNDLYKKFNQFTNNTANATTKVHFNTHELIKDIVALLFRGKPVIIWMPNYSHSVLIVGYRIQTNQYGQGYDYDNCELVIHDSKGIEPPNTLDGAMYTVRKWSWFLEGAYNSSIFYILYPQRDIHQDRALQTVSLPSYPQAEVNLSFNYYKGLAKAAIGLAFDNTVPAGYIWRTHALQFDILPATVKNMNLNLQLYNADLSGNQNVTLKLIITNDKKGITTFSEDYPLTLDISKKPLYFTKSLDTASWLKNFGDTTTIDYSIKTQLFNEKGLYQDGWVVKFKIKGAPIPDKNDFKKFSFSLELMCNWKGTSSDGSIQTGTNSFLAAVYQIPCITNGKTITSSWDGQYGNNYPNKGSAIITIESDNTLTYTITNEETTPYEVVSFTATGAGLPLYSDIGDIQNFGGAKSYKYVQTFQFKSVNKGAEYIQEVTDFLKNSLYDNMAMGFTLFKD